MFATSRISSSHLVCIALAIALPVVSACSSVSAARLHPEAVEVAPGLRPVAAIQANATSAYVLFIPVPGGATLDRVVNQMLVAKAKAMGADKIAQLRFDIDPEHGIWAIFKLFGWRSARASGIAVQITTTDIDGQVSAGPEGPGSRPADSPAAPSSAPASPPAGAGNQ